MKVSGVKFLALIAILVLTSSAISFADVINLSSANQTGYAGQTFTFSGVYNSDLADGLLFDWTSASPCAGADPVGCVDATGFVLASAGEFSSFFDVFVDLGIA